MTSIHPTAIVDPSARIASTAIVGPYCVVGPEVEIGDGTVLLNHVVVSRWTRIGAHKSIEFWNPPTGRGADRTEELARAIHANHQASRLSLAILNTVPVARDLHRAITSVWART